MTLIKLNDAMHFSKNKVGTKAYNLSVMIKSGFNVPDGVCIFGEEIINEISMAWKIMSNQLPLAVRSSMGDEDTEHSSNAGKYKSFLGINSFIKLKNAVKAVSASNNYVSVSVIIQKMIRADYSGVAFTQFYNKSLCYIECVYGLGETLVSGVIEPDKLYFNSEGGLERYEISNKKVCAIFYSDKELKIGEDFFLKSNLNERGVVTLSNGNKNLVVFKHYMHSKKIFMDYSDKFIEITKELIGLLGEHLDIEFSISENVVFILQVRKSIRDLTHLGNTDIYTGECDGIIGSPGFVVGKIMFDLNRVKSEDTDIIFATSQLLPEMVYSENFSKVKGLIVETGSIINHAAIISRELDIPCLVGVENIKAKFCENDIVLLDANKGKIIAEGKSEDNKFML